MEIRKKSNQGEKEGIAVQSEKRQKHCIKRNWDEF